MNSTYVVLVSPLDEISFAAVVAVGYWVAADVAATPPPAATPAATGAAAAGAAAAGAAAAGAAAIYRVSRTFTGWLWEQKAEFLRQAQNS